MTLLSSRRQNTANNFYKISTHRTHTSNHHGGTGPIRISTIPGHFGFSRSQQHPHYFSLQKADTQTNIYAWTATTSLQQNSVFNTLAHRAKVVSTNQQTLHKELEHIRKALQAFSFPPWSLNSLKFKFNHKHNIHNGQYSTDNQQQQQQQQ